MSPRRLTRSASTPPGSAAKAADARLAAVTPAINIGLRVIETANSGIATTTSPSPLAEIPAAHHRRQKNPLSLGGPSKARLPISGATIRAGGACLTAVKPSSSPQPEERPGQRETSNNPCRSPHRVAGRLLRVTRTYSLRFFSRQSSRAFGTPVRSSYRPGAHPGRKNSHFPGFAEKHTLRILPALRVPCQEKKRQTDLTRRRPMAYSRVSRLPKKGVGSWAPVIGAGSY
jgi:hypothetical protein